MVWFVLIAAVICGAVSTLFATEGSRPSRGAGKTIWRNDKKIYVSYRVKPPRFRNVPPGDPVTELSSCGFCKYYAQDGGCRKYGVEHAGDGSVVSTVCDDFESDLFG